MFRLGMTEGVPIESGLISRRIENAQKSVEAQNFDARKHLLEYDDVMNKQRETIIQSPLRSGGKRSARLHPGHRRRRGARAGEYVLPERAAPRRFHVHAETARCFRQRIA